MALPRPILRANFAQNPGYLDPRFLSVRSGVATNMDADGLMKTVPANVLRWHYDPVTRQSRGLLLENTRTNLFWYSRDLTQAQWTKSSVTITADNAVAADGTTTLDLVTASGAGGFVSQGATITAGDKVVVSVYARAGATGWVSLALTDGSNTVTAWFNLSSGVKGSNTAGAGQVLFVRHDITNVGGGLYRCVLNVSTTVTTSITARFSPCSANSAAAATSDAAALGDFQFEASASLGLDASSLITTAGATATRSGEGLTMPVSLIPGWNTAEGAMLFEFIPGPRTQSVSSVVIGGFANGFNDTIYVTYDQSSVFLQINSGGIGYGTLGRTLTIADGVRARLAFRWKVNDIAMVVNGGTPNYDLANVLPVAPVRIGVGVSPWATSSGSPTMPMSLFALWNVALSDAELQNVTRPSPV